MLSGLDTSHYQGQINWLKVKTAGYVFAFAKSTEGAHYTDLSFHANWQGMKAAGIIRGSYAYYRPGESPVDQARHLCHTAVLESGDLPLVIDVEKQGPPPDVYAAGLRKCLHEVEKLSGLKPIIYCSPGWWDSHLSGDFSAWPLFCAHYTHAPHPNLPHGWHHWTWWQFSSSGSVPGISGHVDIDRFNGDRQGLLAMTKP